MDVFDIIGPVMVGPSSSHTAGAVKIGYISRRLLGEAVQKVTIGLSGSFWATGRGHRTDKALVAGLMGFHPDDSRIPDSLQIAKEKGIQAEIIHEERKNTHPNTAALHMTGVNGRRLEVIACSLGGGRIRIQEIDGLTANFCGDYPTLIIHNLDQPGHVTEVTSLLACKSINIATMQLYRDSRGGNAVMVLECDQEIPNETIEHLAHLKGIIKVTYLSLLS